MRERQRQQWSERLPLLMLAAATLGTGVVAASVVQALSPPVLFVDVTAAAGVRFTHGYLDDESLVYQMVAGGVAAGDFDSDGWVDLYVVGGDVGSNRLFRNLGDGSFVDVALSAGVDRPDSTPTSGAGASPTPTPTTTPARLHRGSGPTFADYDGDGDLDLFLGAIEGRGPKLFRNRGDGSFEDVTKAAGLAFELGPYIGASFGDYDRDGDLDLFVAQWGNLITNLNRPDHNRRLDHLWRNNGNGTFTGLTAEVGLAIREAFDIGLLWYWSFTPNFADINNDGWPDLLLASDFGNSQVFLNSGSGTFSETTSPVISDENGMGAAIGDYDNDGDLDWFVSSIYDHDNPHGVDCNPEGTRCAWGGSGNRLYRNDGTGAFEDVTDQAGVRDGAWGWGSCFADFNNDGFLDLFHVNGWGFETARSRFFDKPARLFLANGDGTFTERALEAGINDRGEGRGIVCFDYDRDGDIDVFVMNNGRRFGSSNVIPSALYRNETGNQRRFLQVKLRGRAPNTEAIGARVYVTAGGTTQMRELRAGSNYASQDPVVAHFGLGDATVIDEIRVVWPDQSVETQTAVAADAWVLIEQEGVPTATPSRLPGAATETPTHVPLTPTALPSTPVVEPTLTPTAASPTPTEMGTATPTAPPALRGDASCDGVLTAADFTAVVQVLLSSRTASCDGADLDQDGHVDAKDLESLGTILFAGS